MPNLANPASRLHRLLKEGKRVSSDGNAFTTWASIFDISPDEKAEVLRKLGGVFELPSEIRVEVKELEGVNHDLLLEWLPVVEDAFARINLSSKWSRFIDKIDDTVLYGLKLCDDQLSRNRDRVSVEPSELVEILEEVRELFDSVVASDLDKELRHFILDHLKSIEEAIQDFQIRGPASVEKALHETVGAAYMKPDLSRRIQETEEGNRFWKVIRHIAVVLAIASYSIDIGEAVVPLLPEAAETVQTDESKPSSSQYGSGDAAVTEENEDDEINDEEG